MGLQFFRVPETMQQESCVVCGGNPEVLVAEGVPGGNMLLICKSCLNKLNENESVT